MRGAVIGGLVINGIKVGDLLQLLIAQDDPQ